ncbi:MAG: ABC transporter ATP-binding protein [Candidatus Sumerlaeia bacterium]
MNTEVKQPLLNVQNLSKRFGGVQALQGVNCAVEEGEIFAVIGPNGAGKTTFFNCLTGVVKPTEGAVYFRDYEITGQASHKVAARGIARTWQTIRLFEHMSVLENVLIGCHTQGRCGMFSSVLRLPVQRREEKRLREIAMEQLRLMQIDELANEAVGGLPFLKQRRVELARALAADPGLILLDEPAAGLNTRETAELGRLIRELRDRGVTVVLVEHDMSLVMEISDRVLVLDFGKPIALGAPREVQEDEKVIAVYLGVEDDE